MGKVKTRRMGRYKGGRTGGGGARRRAMGKFLKGRPMSTKEERQAAFRAAHSMAAALERRGGPAWAQ
eukprot:5664758-Prorocentrum_lima.AAC.1